MKKFEISFLHISYKNSPANHLAKTYYLTNANSKKEAKEKTIIKFKKKLQINRFYKKEYIIEVNELKN